MKTMQEILDLALDSKLYISREEYDLQELPLYNEHSYFMCDILETIYSDDLITQEEYEFATDEITDYINSVSENSEEVCSSLESFLERHSLPSSHEDKIKIYENWDLRPKIALQNGLDDV